MNMNEMRKRLGEFAEYLDNCEASLEKGKLSIYFTAYAEAMKKLESVKFIIER